MQTSAVLKIEANDGSKPYLYYFSTDIRPLVAPTVGSLAPKLDDIIVCNLLCYHFESASRHSFLNNAMWGCDYRPTAIDQSASPDIPLMGMLLSSANDSKHGDSVSMAGFTEDLLKKYFKDHYLARGNLTAATIIQETPIDQLSDTLREIVGNNIVIEKDVTLTITRCSDADIGSVTSIFGDALLSPFIDAFDLVKSRLANQEPSLNQSGFSVAVYNNNSGNEADDTIVFKSDYAAKFSARVPPRPKPTVRHGDDQ